MRMPSHDESPRIEGLLRPLRPYDQVIRAVRRASQAVVFMLTVLRIIAVQGLWADPGYTWRRNGVSWLTDMLPRDLPSVHVMTFGPTKGPARISSWKARVIPLALGATALLSLALGITIVGGVLRLLFPVQPLPSSSRHCTCRGSLSVSEALPSRKCRIKLACLTRLAARRFEASPKSH